MPKSNWIQKAVKPKNKGALRNKASKAGLLKKGEKLSSSDLSKLSAKAKKTGDKKTLKQVNLAKTLGKLRK